MFGCSSAAVWKKLPFGAVKLKTHFARVSRRPRNSTCELCMAAVLESRSLFVFAIKSIWEASYWGNWDHIEFIIYYVESMMYWQNLLGIWLGAICTLWCSATPRRLLTASWPTFPLVCLWHTAAGGIYTKGHSLVFPCDQWEEISAYRVLSPQRRICLKMA